MSYAVRRPQRPIVRYYLTVSDFNKSINPELVRGYIKGARVEFILSPGIIIAGSVENGYALDLPGFHYTDEVAIIFGAGAVLMGLGGRGGDPAYSGASGAGSGFRGYDALRVSCNATVDLRLGGKILAGGGGGGCGGTSTVAGVPRAVIGGGGAGGGEGNSPFVNGPVFPPAAGWNGGALVSGGRFEVGGGTGGRTPGTLASGTQGTGGFVVLTTYISPGFGGTGGGGGAASASDTPNLFSHASGGGGSFGAAGGKGKLSSGTPNARGGAGGSGYLQDGADALFAIENIAAVYNGGPPGRAIVTQGFKLTSLVSSASDISGAIA